MKYPYHAWLAGIGFEFGFGFGFELGALNRSDKKTFLDHAQSLSKNRRTRAPASHNPIQKCARKALPPARPERATTARAVV